MNGPSRGFYEFFAGGGMARLGLGPGWHCLFANEWSRKKASSYRANFPPAEELHVDDIWNLQAAALPGHADLAWASFPCQDLSLAGNGAGLEGSRSGTLLKFWQLIRSLAAEGRGVPVVALENVAGALTSNNGSDFQSMCRLASESGYRFGAVVIDAVNFVPQSRPRLFFIALEIGCIPGGCEGSGPCPNWRNERLEAAVEALPDSLRERWIWWNLPAPRGRRVSLADVLHFDDCSLKWRTDDETDRIIAMMSEANLAKLRKAQAYGKKIAGTVYKRVRIENGNRVQRAEVRFDQISGCLRTPSGGSSRQTVLLVEGARVRSRLLTAREAARLMGIPDSYHLPESYNEGYHLAGDGVVVPVVQFLNEHLLSRLVRAEEQGREAA